MKKTGRGKSEVAGGMKKSEVREKRREVKGSQRGRKEVEESRERRRCLNSDA